MVLFGVRAHYPIPSLFEFNIFASQDYLVCYAPAVLVFLITILPKKDEKKKRTDRDKRTRGDGGKKIFVVTREGRGREDFKIGGGVEGSKKSVRMGDSG